MMVVEWLMRRRRRSFGALLTALPTALIALVSAAPVAAHGDVGGAQDLLQDYGVLVFLLAVVLIGAGVVAWVAFAPQPAEGQREKGSDL